MDDPIVREMVRFTLSYRRWIALALALSVVASIVNALSGPPAYTMRAVYTTATTAPEGPVESFEVAARRATDRVAAAVANGELPAGVSLTAQGLMGEPPNLETTHLLEMVASGADPAALRRAIQLAGDELSEKEREIAAQDRDRIRRHFSAIETDLSRLEKLAPTPERHDLFAKEVKELVEAGRFASPVRAYDPGFIGVFEPKRQHRVESLSLPLAIGISGGIALGYALAFCVAGVSAYLRHRRRAHV